MTLSKPKNFCSEKRKPIYRYPYNNNKLWFVSYNNSYESDVKTDSHIIELLYNRDIWEMSSELVVEEKRYINPKESGIKLLVRLRKWLNFKEVFYHLNQIFFIIG